MSRNIIQSIQCTALTKKKQKCKNRTRKSRKCWVHLAWQDNLRIKQSNIRNGGLGLYTWNKAIDRKNTLITEYVGERTSQSAIDAKYGKDALNPYTLCEGNFCIDASLSTDGAGRYANDCHNSKYKCNTKYAKRGRKRGSTDTRTFHLTNSRKIPKHHEIFVPYGRVYWDPHFYKKT